jgi:hypothetical protein
VATELGKWEPQLDWTTPAGETLDAFLKRLPSDASLQITVFGSAPLQMALDRQLVSADVDILLEKDLSELIEQNGFGPGKRAVYIEQCSPSAFITAPDWIHRAFETSRSGVALRFPHPIDILVSKLQRLEEKDLRAFLLVQQTMGLPSEQQLKTVLMNAVDLYRPRFAEEEFKGDIFENTRSVWRALFNKDIDVRNDLIIPGLEKRRSSYGLNAPKHKSVLEKIH